MHEFEKDAVASLEGSIFEPKTPFLYQGVMHNPAQEGTPVNHGYQSGANLIEVPHAMVMAEIELGLHDGTERPISALLNHCTVLKSAPESREALIAFYSTVKKRRSARKRIRVGTKKNEQTKTKVVTTEEKFGTESLQAKPTVKKKVTRKKAKRKATPKKTAKKYTA